MLGHSQKSIQKIFTTQMTAVNEDPSATRLQSRMAEVENELQESYKSHIDESSVMNQDTTFARIVFKGELNKIIAENAEKEKKLAGLLSEIESLYGEPYESYDTLEFNKNNSPYPEKEKLELMLENASKEVDFVENEQCCIKGMLKKEKGFILVITEKLQELSEAHRKITKSYTSAVQSAKKAWNNLTLVNNQITILKKDMRQRKNNFLLSYDKQKTRKTEREKDITRIIKSISQKSLSVTDKKKMQLQFKGMLKEQSRVFEENQLIKQSFLKDLKVYEEKLKIINKVIKGSGLKAMIKLDEKGVNTIIRAFNQLKYQETSLSSRFQILTSESSEKKREHEKYYNKLVRLKEVNKEMIEVDSLSTITFNQLKESIENNVKIVSKAEDCTRTEELVLKIYLDVLNVAIVSMMFLMEIKEQGNLIDLALQQYIKSTNTHLDTLKRGFFYKREIIGLKQVPIKKTGPRLLDTNESSLDYYNKQIFPYFSLTASEISSIFTKRFGPSGEDSERFCRFLKKKPILYSYITPETLTSYLYDCETTQDSYKNINKLLKKSHSGYQSQYLNLITLTLNIVLKVRSQIKLEILQIQKLYPSYDPLDPNFFDQLMKIPKRRSLKMPTMLKDRLHSSANLDEEIKSEIPQKTYERLKSMKKERKFEDKCEGKAKIAELENPQAVLKEVLSIEEKIKRIKSRERKAELMDTVYDIGAARMLKQPWTPRIKRAKTQDKGIRAKISLEMLTPKPRAFNIKL